jgi:hypothetical protein
MGLLGSSICWHSLFVCDSSFSVNSLHNVFEFSFEFSHLSVDGTGISLGVSIEPLETVFGKFDNGFLVLVGEGVLDLIIVHGVLHGEAVVLQLVLGFNLLGNSLIISLESLGVLEHLFDLVLGESSLIVGDGDSLLLSGVLVGGGDVKDTIGINLEGNNNLWNSSGSWWDSIEVEFTEDMVITGHLSLSFENLNEDTGLVVSVSGEVLGLLGWDGGVSLDNVGHNTSNSLDSHGKWGDIEEKELLSLFVTLSGKDGSLDGGTVSDSFIWVDGLVECLSVEEVGEHGLNLWDSGGSTDQNDLVDLSLSDTGILEDVLNWWHTFLEEIHAEFLELSSGDVGVVVLSLSKGLALNWGLMCR